MVRRQTKRKARNVLYFIFLSTLFLFILVIFIGVWKFFSPLIFGGSDSYGKIIKPVVSKVTLQKLKDKLNDKNIQMEELNQASDSGLIKGRIRDGATVIFSQTADPVWQVDSLYLIISRTTVDNKKPEMIDLTNSRPIVKF